MSSVRKEWPVGMRVALTVFAGALGCALAWYGVNLQVEVLLVALAAIAAALLGFPAGILVAVASAAVLHYARVSAHAGDAFTGPFFLLVGGLAASALFFGTPGALEPANDAESAQKALSDRARALTAPEPDRYLPSGSVRRGALSELAAGVREIAQGDFSRGLDASDPDLRELAVALNELLFTVRDFVSDVRESAQQLEHAGMDLAELASSAIATTDDARIANERFAADLHERFETLLKTRQVTAPAIEEVSGISARGVAAAARIVGQFEASAQRVLDGSDALSDSTLQAAQIAAVGGGAAEAAIEGAREVERTVAALASDLGRLSELNGSLDGAARTLGRIARRMDLTALNASIAASRDAGDARGFVAFVNEIRTLASTAVRAADEMVRATEQSRRVVDESVTAGGHLSYRAAEVSANAGAAGGAIRKILASTDAAHGRVAEIGVTARALGAASERAAAYLGEAVYPAAPPSEDVELSSPPPALPAPTVSTFAGAQDRAFEAVSRSNAEFAEASWRMLGAGRQIEEIASRLRMLVAGITLESGDADSNYRNARASASDTASIVPSSRRTESAPPDSSEIAEHSNGFSSPSL